MSNDDSKYYGKIKFKHPNFYGFITTDDGGSAIGDQFFHGTAAFDWDGLREGDAVCFEIEDDSRTGKPVARRVVKCD